jgi:hypothetical protein
VRHSFTKVDLESKRLHESLLMRRTQKDCYMDMIPKRRFGVALFGVWESHVQIFLVIMALGPRRFSNISLVYQPARRDAYGLLGLRVCSKSQTGVYARVLDFS